MPKPRSCTPENEEMLSSDGSLTNGSEELLGLSESRERQGVTHQAAPTQWIQEIALVISSAVSGHLTVRVMERSFN